MGTPAMSIEPGASLLPLLVWASPAFPVGAFAYSHGLEWVAESGRVRDRTSLEGWLGDLLEHGAPRNDAILLAAAWQAVADKQRTGAASCPERGQDRPEGRGDLAAAGARGAPSRSRAGGGERALADVNDLALALAGSRERHLETSQQGNAFVLAARAAWPCAALDRLVEAVPGDVAYPIAFATAAAGHAVPLPAVLEAFVLGVVANLVSAAVRLGVVGQTDGQRVLATLADPLRLVAAAAATATLDDLGTAAFASDLAALQHETQYSRLFRS